MKNLSIDQTEIVSGGNTSGAFKTLRAEWRTMRKQIKRGEFPSWDEVAEIANPLHELALQGDRDAGKVFANLLMVTSKAGYGPNGQMPGDSGGTNMPAPVGAGGGATASSGAKPHPDATYFI